jgi:hypothetical protein
MRLSFVLSFLCLKSGLVRCVGAWRSGEGQLKKTPLLAWFLLRFSVRHSLETGLVLGGKKLAGLATGRWDNGVCWHGIDTCKFGTGIGTSKEEADRHSVVRIFSFV